MLNREELRQLFKTPTLLKHRIALALIYSGGLRSQEVSNMKISDIDFEITGIRTLSGKNNIMLILAILNYLIYRNGKIMSKKFKKYLKTSKTSFLRNKKRMKMQKQDQNITQTIPNQPEIWLLMEHK